MNLSDELDVAYEEEEERKGEYSSD